MSVSKSSESDSSVNGGMMLYAVVFYFIFVINIIKFKLILKVLPAGPNYQK